MVWKVIFYTANLNWFSQVQICFTSITKHTDTFIYETNFSSIQFQLCGTSLQAVTRLLEVCSWCKLQLITTHVLIFSLFSTNYNWIHVIITVIDFDIKHTQLIIVFLFFRLMYICHNTIYLCVLMARSKFSADFANKLWNFELTFSHMGYQSVQFVQQFTKDEVWCRVEWLGSHDAHYRKLMYRWESNPTYLIYLCI